MIASKRSVFIADDNSSDINLAKYALAELGYDGPFETAKNGEELIAHLRGLVDDPKAVRPRVLVLDLNMPKASGLDVLRFIHGQPSLRDIPVVVLTTSDSPKDRDACMALGIHSYIVKSFNLDEFIASLKPVADMVKNA